VTWTGVVWREAGTYGPGGTFEQQVQLGRHSFPVKPAVGAILKIGSEEYRVISVAGGFCHVGPTEMRLRWRPPQTDQR
jgi:hypothetical protein